MKNAVLVRHNGDIVIGNIFLRGLPYAVMVTGNSPTFLTASKVFFRASLTGSRQMPDPMY